VTIQTSAFSSLLTSNSIRQLSTNSSFFQGFAILYVPTGGASHIDEVRSTRDGSMVTHVDLHTGLVWRRVKHFSGYLVSAGYSCASVGVDGTCNVDDPTNIVAPPLVQASTFGIVFVGDSTFTMSVIVDP
jgi:hypothetical protein